MKAMIFAAGLGTRLGEITKDIPKALVEINGKTLLESAVEKCTNEGFDDIIINIHHLPELILAEVKRLTGLGYKIRVSDETGELLETGGGLFKARGFFDDKPFLIYNADIITDVSLNGIYHFHLKSGGLATLLVRIREGNRYLLVDERKRLKGWRNKATDEEILVTSPSGNLKEIAFCGVHIVDPAIFSFMKVGVYSLIPLYLELAGNNNIYTYQYDEGYWFDVGTPGKLSEAKRFIANRQ